MPHGPFPSKNQIHSLPRPRQFQADSPYHGSLQRFVPTRPPTKLQASMQPVVGSGQVTLQSSNMYNSRPFIFPFSDSKLVSAAETCFQMLRGLLLGEHAVYALSPPWTKVQGYFVHLCTVHPINAEVFKFKDQLKPCHFSTSSRRLVAKFGSGK